MPPLLPSRFGDHDGFYHDPAEGLHESEGGHYAQVRDGGRVVWPHVYNPCCAATEAQYFAEIVVVMPSRYAVVGDETGLSNSISRHIVEEAQVILW
jgi:hypothetical protein